MDTSECEEDGTSAADDYRHDSQDKSRNLTEQAEANDFISV
jgi:hypothetical protein